jgi:hypothetical protein
VEVIFVLIAASSKGREGGRETRIRTKKKKKKEKEKEKEKESPIQCNGHPAGPWVSVWISISWPISAEHELN